MNVARVLPPGRLSTRSLQQRTRSEYAGMLPNVPPFTYTDRVQTTTPPLKVGIVQDVSASQAGAAECCGVRGVGAGESCHQIPDAKVAMVTFGNAVHSIIKPQTKVEKVPVVNTNAGTEYFLESLKALEGELELIRPGAARLVVILTDGQLTSMICRAGTLRCTG